MRWRILFFTAVFCAVFVLGGAYIALTIRSGTSDLDRVIQLHQVEIMREQLLFRVKTVQSGIKAKNTRFFRGVDQTINDVLIMEAAASECVRCHHVGPQREIISSLNAQILEYEGRISRMFTFRANVARLEEEENDAYWAGQNLIDKINDMISLTTRNLQRRTQNVVATIDRSNRLLYGLLALGPVLAIGLAIAYLKAFAQPVEILLDATRRLKNGDLDFRVGGLKREFKEVGESFNEMAQALKEQMTRMQHAEQMAACGKIAAGLAHEIKNPLAGIKISLQVLGEELELAVDDRDLLNRAQEEIARIDSMMKGLLDYARPRDPELEPVDVNRVLDKAIELATKPNAKSHDGVRVTVRRELDERLPRIYADPRHLLQVFLNLMLNGIEAMPTGGSLRVVTASSTDSVTVEVCDEGRGVSAENLERIFEPFFTTKGKGTGLGLSISKSLVEQHGGSIEVENSSSRGACFRVRLPVGDSLEATAA